jgi:hypothetical protein
VDRPRDEKHRDEPVPAWRRCPGDQVGPEDEDRVAGDRVERSGNDGRQECRGDEQQEDRRVQDGDLVEGAPEVGRGGSRKKANDHDTGRPDANVDQHIGNDERGRDEAREEQGPEVSQGRAQAEGDDTGNCCRNDGRAPAGREPGDDDRQRHDRRNAKARHDDGPEVPAGSPAGHPSEERAAGVAQRGIGRHRSLHPGCDGSLSALRPLPFDID